MTWCGVYRWQLSTVLQYDLHLVLQTLQFQKMDACHKFSGRAGISHYSLMSALLRVTLMLALNRSLLNRECTLTNVLKALALIISI